MQHPDETEPGGVHGAAGHQTAHYGGVDNLEVMEEALNYNAFLQRLVTSSAQPQHTLLDFGAGTGTLARPLAAAGYRVRCIEPDDRLRARLRAAGLDAVATIDEIAAGSAEVIYAINVLEHIPDDRATILALRERLKPGGRLVVYVPAFPLLFSSMDRAVGHVRRYRLAQLSRLLGAAGLLVEHVAYQDCLGFGAALLFKLIGNDSGTISRSALVAYDRYVFPISHFLDRQFGRWFGKNLHAVARR